VLNCNGNIDLKKTIFPISACVKKLALLARKKGVLRLILFKIRNLFITAPYYGVLFFPEQKHIYRLI
jgi:hypothetical protein